MKDEEHNVWIYGFLNGLTLRIAVSAMFVLTHIAF